MQLEVLYKMYNEAKTSSTMLKYILVQLAPQGGQEKLLETLFPEVSSKQKVQDEEFDVDALFENADMDFTKAFKAIEEMYEELEGQEEEDTVASQLFSFGDDDGTE